jgi:DNA-directed RNA polymerase specialized sigma24 family protein
MSGANCSTRHWAQRERHWQRISGTKCSARLRKPANGIRTIGPPYPNLESYLIGVFHHRFNRFLKREHERAETVELVSSALDLERFEAAVDSDWAEQLERAIAVRQITDRMDGWTRKVWQARQYGFSWKEISGWLGVTEQQAKMKFQYNLEKIRQNIVRMVKRPRP